MIEGLHVLAMLGFHRLDTHLRGSIFIQRSIHRSHHCEWFHHFTRFLCLRSSSSYSLGLFYVGPQAGWLRGHVL